ncbi:MAG: hypothetical protein QE285_05890 [Aquabacterium sp.]|nr:hypothetical protein [Aquabacterium sp.]
MRFARPLTIALLSLAGLAAAQATTTDAPRVDARQAHQQARIADGVANGSLTRPEARRLQQQQRHIRHAERHAKADGTVTAQERHRLHRLQDRASRNIQRQRHDAQVQPHRAG